ncbi:hypothetical protein BOX15_Mlig027113g1 [Macrostomum lignano]|uniref:Uncharacterized protein n=1 Tax=Macrostomum lignano TaxID=282301 RepID=A0A267FUQ3_9PLAT|nr:hypothetical protein BOX15_Mlig019489g1 [Macrostomum lignano]PAA77466.1 hypothetical protein BOX15_Mlig025236g1 [Macrostomum lignano]PAA79674.1 hypothetical protein BOX15_Mlig027113g1 [Macrostomum lignano]
MKWQFALGLLLCVALAVYANPAEREDNDDLDEGPNDDLADMDQPELDDSNEDAHPELKWFSRWFRITYRRRGGERRYLRSYFRLG